MWTDRQDSPFCPNIAATPGGEQVWFALKDIGKTVVFDARPPCPILKTTRDCCKRCKLPSRDWSPSSPYVLDLGSQANGEYRPQSGKLEGLWLRLRYADGSDGDQSLQQWRAVLNYSVEFGR